ncbi:hypothetical protein ACFLZX_03660 [Nanoarchaeota archaeon]
MKYYSSSISAPVYAKSGVQEHTIDLVIHPKQNGILVINYPGIRATVDGHSGKYRRIGEILHDKVGAVVRSSNHKIEDADQKQYLKDNLRRIIEHSLLNADHIAGKSDPDVYLMGVSGGAGAIGAVAYECPLVKKVLMIAPAESAGREDILRGLEQFTGELYITAGENDELVKKAPEVFHEAAKNAKVRKIVRVPFGDHRFSGRNGGKIFSKAPLWAFLGEESYPDPEGGIELYGGPTTATKLWQVHVTRELGLKGKIRF